MNKNAPIPVRFDAPEERQIAEIAAQSGLSKSEIIRRAVRLLGIEAEKREDIGFIITELGPKPEASKTGFHRIMEQAGEGRAADKEKSKLQQPSGCPPPPAQLYVFKKSDSKKKSK